MVDSTDGHLDSVMSRLSAVKSDNQDGPLTGSGIAKLIKARRNALGKKHGRFVCGRIADPSYFEEESSDEELEEGKANILTFSEDYANEASIDDDNEDSTGPTVRDFLGSELTLYINDFVDTEPIQIPREVLKIPRPDQLGTAARLKFLAEESKFKGGILEDPIGLGKTFSIILTILCTTKDARTGPAVIVTKKSFVTHWDEQFRIHLKPEHRCWVLIVHHPISAFALSHYDVIIINYEYVQRQSAAKLKFESSHIGSATTTDPDRPHAITPIHLSS